MNHIKPWHMVKEMLWYHRCRVSEKNSYKYKYHLRRGNLMVSTDVLQTPSSPVKLTGHNQKTDDNHNGSTKQQNSNKCSIHHTLPPDLDCTNQTRGIESRIEANVKSIIEFFVHFLSIWQVILSPISGFLAHNLYSNNLRTLKTCDNTIMQVKQQHHGSQHWKFNAARPKLSPVIYNLLYPFTVPNDRIKRLDRTDNFKIMHYSEKVVSWPKTMS